MNEGTNRIDDPFLHLLAKAVVVLTEQQEKTTKILLEIRELVSSMSTQLCALSSQHDLKNSRVTPEKEEHPLLILSVRDELKETLAALVKLYIDKKRHVSIKELEKSLNFGYRTIAIHLKQLEEANPSLIELPITRRTLEEYLKDIEQQGNPQGVDLDLPETAGRAYFYKPLDSVMRYLG